MPKVRRQNLPRPLWHHLLQRMQERSISPHDLRLLAEWLDQEPEVPNGEWFKRFPGMIACGEGELIKTFLTPSQTPFGQELK